MKWLDLGRREQPSQKTKKTAKRQKNNVEKKYEAQSIDLSPNIRIRNMIK